MEDTPNGEFFLEAEFSDFDQFAEMIRSWSLDFFQLESGPFSASFRQFGFPGCNLGEARFSRNLEQHGAPPSGMRTFGIQRPGAPPYKWRGHEIRNNELLFFPRNSELYSLSKGGFHVYSFSVEEEIILRKAHLSGCERFEDYLEGDQEVFSLRPERMLELNRLCGQLFSIAVEPNGMQIVAREELLRQIVANLVEGILEGSGMTPQRETTRQRAEAIRRARELVNDCRNHPLTVEKICEETGIKARTLRYAFQEEYGLSPKQWLKLRTLNHIRKELRDSAVSDYSVTEIANRWGVWHMGQFAIDYRRLFHERPSETLRRKNS